MQQPDPFHPLGTAARILRWQRRTCRLVLQRPGARRPRNRWPGPCRTPPAGRACRPAPRRCDPCCPCRPRRPAAPAWSGRDGVEDSGSQRGAVVRDDDRRDNVLRIGIVWRQERSACCFGVAGKTGQQVGAIVPGRGVPVNNTRIRRCRMARPGSAPADPAPPAWLHGLALQPPALALRQATPDAETLIVLERVAQALGADLAAAADPLGLPGRAALLREERLRIGLRASARSCQPSSPASSAPMPNPSCTSETMTSSQRTSCPIQAPWSRAQLPRAARIT